MDPAVAAAMTAQRLPAWKRWGMVALTFYALKGTVWLLLGWAFFGGRK